MLKLRRRKKYQPNNLSKAIGLAFRSKLFLHFMFHSLFTLLFLGFVATEAMNKDITAAGVLNYVLPPAWSFWILWMRAIAFLNDLHNDSISFHIDFFLGGKTEFSQTILQPSAIHKSHNVLFYLAIMATLGS